MHRVISVYLPTWPTDLMRRLPDGVAPPRDLPLVLKGSDGRRRVVTAVDDFAHSLGIHVGMPVAKAQALVNDLHLVDADPQADLAELEALALWGLRRYSPLVMVDPPDGLVLDVTGATHLHGGEHDLLQDIVAQLTERGVAAKVALSETWGASYALARYLPAPITLIAPGKTNDTLLRLPVEALRLPAATLDDLRVLGFDTIGELASQPRAPLTLRFGPELFRRIDMAFGRLAQPITPAEPPEMILVRRAFFDMEGALYRVYSAPDRVTDLMLQPGETVQAISAGDTARWIIGDTKSGEGAAARTHILIKPHTSGLKTNLVVLTSVRTYHLQLESTPSTYMAAVSWRYPSSPVVTVHTPAKAEPLEVSGPSPDLTKLNFGYVIEGATPAWRPRQVFDDGRKTYIVFAREGAISTAPALFLLGSDGKSQLVNYRVEANGMYILDRLIDVAELRLGTTPQTVVRLRRSDAAIATTKSKGRRHD